NVEFYRVHSRHEIEVRYWERGVGPTFSSGTGSCAAAAAAILGGQAESPVTVKTVAGDLQVRWEKDGIYLTGPAEIVCRGEFLCGREHSSAPAATQTGAMRKAPYSEGASASGAAGPSKNNLVNCSSR
ncbi:MAG: hypothetical protein IH935_06630, partial [Acidobacteria bacterium]|nr:hypothetical protein [Acidobacteriota bacterium]